MNLANFSAFRAVLLTGTVTATSEVLGRSQPAVSRMLAKLENDLGLTLFERRKGLIVPTRAAHQLLDEVERVYAALDSVKTLSSRLSKGDGASIRLAAMPALGIGFLPLAIGRFNSIWKTTKIELNVRLSPNVEEWAAAQHIDFGLAEMPFFRSGFSVEVFSNAPYSCVVPTDHKLADRASIAPKDLRNEPLVYWTTFLPSRPLFDSAFQSAGVDISPIVETTYTLSAYELVKSGMGIGFIDPFTAALQNDPRVRIVPFTPKIPFNVGLLRPNTKKLNAANSDLLDMILTERDRLLPMLPG